MASRLLRLYDFTDLRPDRSQSENGGYQKSSNKVHLSVGKPQRAYTENYMIISKLTLRRMIWKPAYITRDHA